MGSFPTRPRPSVRRTIVKAFKKAPQKSEKWLAKAICGSLCIDGCRENKVKHLEKVKIVHFLLKIQTSSGWYLLPSRESREQYDDLSVHN